MARWKFEEVPAKLVEQDPTQRDQFNNDEVGLAEALVREVIQNSTDAAAGSDPVKVSFAVRTLDAPSTDLLRQMFEDLRPHLTACALSEAPLGTPSATILTVEDFGTKGLTGKTDDRDNDNFRNFWRRHGRSGKGGASGGRWGLGKLVYSSSSELHAFFGLTVREGDARPLLMGQAVLKNHEIGSHHHPAHGFWFSEYGGPEEIQLPVSETSVIESFCTLCGVVRKNQPGLSIVVPYLKHNIKHPALIDAVVRNYYFPILAGKLVVEVGSILIDQKTFHAVAAENAKVYPGHPIALSFVEIVSKELTQPPSVVAITALGTKGITDKTFSATQLETLKNDYREGKLIRARLPLVLKSRDRGELKTYIDVFLQMLPEGQKPFALFARGSITVPGEVRYFSGVQAFGAMVASDKDVVEFLGDAENPAHTYWIASAEKLTERWSSSGMVARIRHALRELHFLVAEQVAREDRNALIDLFSLVDASRPSTGSKKRSNKPATPIISREKAISIKGRKGGFDIVAGPGALNWSYPKKIRIRVAYDTMVGDPFAAHSKYDFDFSKGEINVEAKDAIVEPKSSYVLEVSVTGPEFVVGGSGFDTNRDIVVDVRAY